MFATYSCSVIKLFREEIASDLQSKFKTKISINEIKKNKNDLNNIIKDNSNIILKRKRDSNNQITIR